MSPAAEKFNELNDSRVIKWDGLSDGGKWTRAIEAMELYAQSLKEENERLDRDYNDKRNECNRLLSKCSDLESDLVKAVDLVKTLRGKFNKYGYLERHSLGDQLTNFIDLFLFTKSKIESSPTVKPEQKEEPNGEKLSKAMGYEPTEYNGLECGKCNCVEIAEIQNGGPVKNVACLKPQDFIAKAKLKA